MFGGSFFGPSQVRFLSSAFCFPMAPKTVLKRPAIMKKPGAASKSKPSAREIGAESHLQKDIHEDLCIVARYKPGGKVYVIPSGLLLVFAMGHTILKPRQFIYSCS